MPPVRGDRACPRESRRGAPLPRGACKWPADFGPPAPPAPPRMNSSTPTGLTVKRRTPRCEGDRARHPQAMAPVFARHRQTHLAIRERDRACSEISPADAGSLGELPAQRVGIVHGCQACEVLANVSRRATVPRGAILQEWQALRHVVSFLVHVPGDEIWLELVIERIEQGLQLRTFAVAGERYLLDRTQIEIDRTEVATSGERVLTHGAGHCPQQFARPAGVIIVAGHRTQPQQHVRGYRVAGWRRPVMEIPGSGDRSLVAGTGVKETRPVRVAKLHHHQVCETEGLVEPSGVKRRPVQSEQTINEECIVLEEAGDARIAVLPAAQKSAIPLQVLENECGIPHGDISKVVTVEDARSVSERPQHETVPTGDHLLVTTRALAQFPDLKQTPLDLSK